MNLNGASGAVIGALLAKELQLETPRASTSAPPAAKENPAGRIMIQEQAIDLATCKKICEYAAASPRERAGVLDISYDTTQKVQSYVDPKARDTYIVGLNRSHYDMLKPIFHRLFVTYVEPFFKLKIEWWETPQLLSYIEGGRYDPHVDADRWVKSEGGKGGTWEPYLDRQISMLLYLNDGFTGGKLNFPDHQVKIQPKPGLLVAFPSSSQYRHGAEPTLSGERLVLVTWAAAIGAPRLRERPPSVIFMNEFERKK